MKIKHPKSNQNYLISGNVKQNIKNPSQEHLSQTMLCWPSEKYLDWMTRQNKEFSKLSALGPEKIKPGQESSIDCISAPTYSWKSFL